jgi:hypothetical protein
VEDPRAGVPPRGSLRSDLWRSAFRSPRIHRRSWVADERKPIADDEIERLRYTARATIALIGLQNDAFLDRVPEAALRISASDATPLTQRVVARILVNLARAAAHA